MVPNGERRRGEPGALYVVATPIGNPDDITIRAIETLRAVDVVACEDTRRTGVLLAAHGIGKRLISYFEHNEERRIPELIERLQAGEAIALVTDAGTPAISDPGFRLVRAAHHAGLRVIAIPGPSALIAALSVAGLPTDRFAFEGFLPSRGGARRKVLKALGREPRTMVFFEAGRRLGETLRLMSEIFGSDREAAILREMTKTHEGTIRATLGELSARFEREAALGEITIVIRGARREGAEAGREKTTFSIDALLAAGLSLKQASAVVAKLSGIPRREIYNQALKARRASSD